MASGAALRRLKKEYATLLKDPAPGAIARPLESNYLHAHFLLYGPVFYDTPYEGGVYHGVLKFPSTYPMKPPSVQLCTPSGRFVPERKICFSLSDFHPELWNPMWSIRTILTGLVSFMNGEEMTTGGMAASVDTRVDFAKKSLAFCREKDVLAREVFGEVLDGIAKERRGLDEEDRWPPVRPVVTVVVPSSVSKVKPTGIAPATNATDSTQPASSTTSTSTSSGKNAAKNKKKREREKRKKATKKFLTNLSIQIPIFLRAIHKRLLEEHQIDTTNTTDGFFHPDHVCWRTESIEEYTDLVTALRSSPDDASLLIESEIGGRSIATFRLTKGVLVEGIGSSETAAAEAAPGVVVVDVVEIPAPKDGSPYRSGLEHVEFVIGGGGGGGEGEDKGPLSPRNSDIHRSVLDGFVRKHSQVDFNLKARDKEINPDVSMKVELDDFGTCSVKFHLVSLGNVIEYEKDIGTVEKSSFVE